MSSFKILELQTQIFTISCLLQAEGEPKEGFYKRSWGKGEVFRSGGRFAKNPNSGGASETASEGESNSFDINGAIDKAISKANELKGRVADPFVNKLTSTLKKFKQTEIAASAESISDTIASSFEEFEDIDDEILEKTRDAIESNEMEKAIDALGDVVGEISPEAREAFDDSVAEAKSAITKDKKGNGLGEAAKKVAKKLGEVLPKLAVPAAATAVILGATLGLGAVAGGAAVAMVAGGAVASKTFSIPNLQQRGGKHAQEKQLLHDDRDLAGYYSSYYKGVLSNLAFDASVATAVIGGAVLGAIVVSEMSEDN